MYNKSLYEKYGLDTPKTWEEVLSDATIFKNNDMYMYLIGHKHIVLMLFTYWEQVNQKSAFDSKGKNVLNSKDIEFMLETYKKLKEKNVIYVVGSDEEQEEMLRERTASGVFGWNSQISNLSSTLEGVGDTLTIGDFVLLKENGYSGYFIKPATMLAIGRDTEHPKEAAIFLNYLLNGRENVLLQQCEKGVPVSKQAEGELMEAGLLNNMEYRAKLLIDYNRSILLDEPVALEDTDFYQSFVKLADLYLDDKFPIDRAAQSILSLLDNLEEE